MKMIATVSWNSAPVNGVSTGWPRPRPAKWWTTELQKKFADNGVQLHGGYGYMSEYPISKAYTDSRIQTIYGGTTEIQKEIIGRMLGI